MPEASCPVLGITSLLIPAAITKVLLLIVLPDWSISVASAVPLLSAATSNSSVLLKGLITEIKKKGSAGEAANRIVLE